MKCPKCGTEMKIGECGCYDEYAIFCRPNSPGPGCWNGVIYCPKCEE